MMDVKEFDLAFLDAIDDTIGIMQRWHNAGSGVRFRFGLPPGVRLMQATHADHKESSTKGVVECSEGLSHGDDQ
jgi:hypothetical protein